MKITRGHRFALSHAAALLPYSDGVFSRAFYGSVIFIFADFMTLHQKLPYRKNSILIGDGQSGTLAWLNLLCADIMAISKGLLCFEVACFYSVLPGCNVYGYARCMDKSSRPWHMVIMCK